MRARVGATLVVAACLLAACGQASDGLAAAATAPTIAPGLIPPSLHGGQLGTYEYAKAGKGFAKAGPKSLVGDGKLWEIRRSARLVGTIQISTLLPKVKVSSARDRGAIVAQLMPGQLTKLAVGGTEVFTSAAPDKTTYLWFGNQLFELLQLKTTVGTQLDAAGAESVVRELIDFQSPTKQLDIPSDKRAKTTHVRDDDAE
ncbi:MAG: hypothetical protein QOK28_3098 [Actinomycetota bacterium]|jgi:hypothetical protein